MKGGAISTLTWEQEKEPNVKALRSIGDDVLITEVRSVDRKLKAITFEVSSEEYLEELKDNIIQELENQGFSEVLNDETYSVRVVGPSMGQSFLENTKVALLIGFALMGGVIFYSFKEPFVSGIVIMGAFLNMFASLAAMTFLGIELSPITLAAILTIIAYSADSEVLLAVKVLKGERDLFEDASTAVGTGLTMTATVFTSLLVLVTISNVQMLKELAIVLMVGLIIDAIKTWALNLTLVLWYIEWRKHR